MWSQELNTNNFQDLDTTKLYLQLTYSLCAKQYIPRTWEISLETTQTQTEILIFEKQFSAFGYIESKI